jgi:high-affinity iron transporter
MVSALLIALREGLEATLIVGIVFGYLGRIGRRDRMGVAWAGVMTAALASALIAITMRVIGAELEEPYEQIFEGTTMLIAVAVLTWMIFWMRYQARFLQRDLERQVQSVVARGQSWGIFALAFLAVFREGVETALFLAANAFAADAFGTIVGTLLGLAIAIFAGVLIYNFAVQLDVKIVFDTTSILLIIFAAGLIAHGVHEFQEIGWLPVLTMTAWNTESFLSNDSPLGSLLRSLVGYNDQPSWLEVVIYVGYWVIVLQAVRWWTAQLSTRLEKQHA